MERWAIPSSEKEELAMTNFAELHLSESAHQLMLAAAERLDVSVYGDLANRGRFLRECDPLTDLIEQSHLMDALQRLRSGELVCLVLKNVPIDPGLPPAPLDGLIPRGKQAFVSEAMACAIAQVIGVPSALLGEKNVELIHQITPVEGLETTQSNAGQVALQMHQDLLPNPDLSWLPYHAAMATWLILSGLQVGAGGTSTFVSALDDGLELLDPAVIAILKESQFATEPPDSFKLDGMVGGLPVHPILIEHGGKMEAAFDVSSNVQPIDPGNHEAAAAIKALHDALVSVKREVFIEPSTMVLFNNRRVVHGRGAVQPGVSTPGKKRWIQRLQVFEPERLVKLSMQYVQVTLQAGGGWLHLSEVGRQPTGRLAELIRTAA